MDEIIDRLTKEANLSPEQAQKALETIVNFVKEKFPMIGGAVDQMFASGPDKDEEPGIGGASLGGFN